MARGTLRLLVHPHFGGVFWGKFFSFGGVMVQTLVVSIMAFDATGSTLAVAVVNAALFAPQILVGPWSGVHADRGYAVLQIIVGRSLGGVGVAALALWAGSVGEVSGWSAIAVISGASVVSGVGLAISAAPMNSLVPQLVSRAELPLAMSLNTVPMSVGRVAGPAFGAFLLAAYGTVPALWVAAAGQAALAALVLVTRPPAGPKRPRTPDGSLRRAWHHVRHRDATLLRLLFAVTLVCFASEPVFILAPSYADGFGGGATLVGVMSAFFGVGAALGLGLALLLEGRQSHGRVAALGLLVMVLGSVVCAVAPWLPLAHAGFVLTGVGFTVAMTGVSTSLQLRVPEELRGRVMGLWMIGFVGGRPVTALFVGAVADLASDRVAFAAVAMVTLAAACWLRLSRLGSEVA